MKRVILVFTVVLSSVLVNAQVSFGFKAGLNNSTLGGDDADISGKKSNTGFNFGVMAAIPLSTHFVFQPEIMYSANQGMEFRPTTTSETNYNLNYVNIPLMLKYKSMGFYGEAGPYFGFLTSGNIKTKTSSTTTEIDIKDTFDGTDMGVALGTGYVMKSGLGLGVRYNMGLQNIYDATTPELKNRYWQVNLIYILAKK
jgi:Outer membrane protein beta-barrel domain